MAPSARSLGRCGTTFGKFCLLLSLCVSLRGAEAKCKGCAVSLIPVCGSDGVTYMSECLATCAGVSFTQGACAGDPLADMFDAPSPPKGSSTTMSGTTGGPPTGTPVSELPSPPTNPGDSVATTISSQDVARYSAEGYRLLGRVRLTAPDPAKIAAAGRRTAQDPAGPPPATGSSNKVTETDTSTESTSQAKTATAAKVQKTTSTTSSSARVGEKVTTERTRVLRVTRSGLLYARDLPAVTLPATATSIVDPYVPDSLPPPNQIGHRRGRSLSYIFGTDDRVSCPFNTRPQFPYSAIGQLTMLGADSAQGYMHMCTGSLIGNRTVLTAAHCLFDTDTKSFYNSWKYAPARYVDPSTGKAINPYNTYSYVYYEVAQTYTTRTADDADYFFWDYAVLELPLDLGSQLGHLGVGLPNACSAATPYKVQTIGYPGDKPSGTCISTSCTFTYDACSDRTVDHTCDVFGGQSGSPFISSNNFVMGIIVGDTTWTDSTGKVTKVISSAVNVMSPTTNSAILGWLAKYSDGSGTGNGGGLGSSIPSPSPKSSSPSPTPSPSPSASSPQPNGDPCTTEGALSIANLGGDPAKKLYGRVDICHNGVWGSICSDGFNNAAATIVCKRFAGYGYIKGVVLNATATPDGTGPVWLGNLACKPNNATQVRLQDCMVKPWGSKCSHTKDVGVRCLKS